jgi:hypothetical protein
MQATSNIGGAQVAWDTFSGRMPDRDTSSDEAVAGRVRRLREVLEYPTSTAFAGFLDVGVNRWINVENGFPLSKDLALKIVQRVPGLTLDWLYLGKDDGLPFHLARKLGETAPVGKSRTRRSSR